MPGSTTTVTNGGGGGGAASLPPPQPGTVKARIKPASHNAEPCLPFIVASICSPTVPPTTSGNAPLVSKEGAVA